MSQGRKSLFVFIGIVVFLVIYLSYIGKQRKESVQQYVMNPKLGDIYKMQREDKEEGRYITYYKVKDIGKESIYFYPGTITADGLHDSFLKHFDTTETVVFSRRELIEIRDGLWNNYKKDYTTLLEIERK